MASPLELREGASLQPVVMADFEYKLQNKEEYTCGINAALVLDCGTQSAHCQNKCGLDSIEGMMVFVGVSLDRLVVKIVVLQPQ